MTIENTIEMIPITKLQLSKANPRKSVDEKAIAGLAQSIRTDGLLQNLVVARPEGRKRKYPIISGERRYRALQHLIDTGDLPGDVSVPVEIREGLSEEETLRIATVENVQRVDLSPLEEAEAIKVLAHDGEKLGDIVAQTGLSESTIKRRLVLLELSETVKEALSSEQITLSQAEALSLASHEEQETLLPHIVGGWYSSAEDIREQILGDAPSVAMAVFDKAEYKGTYTADLLADDETTYFDDADQFYDLQKVAAEKMVEAFDKDHDWAELIEGSFSSAGYRQAKKGEAGGVIVSLSPEGRVDVHKGLIRQDIDTSVSDALKATPKATYAKPLCEYFAMHKSAAVQAELIKNPRTAKEIGVAQMLYRASAHGCLSYLRKEGTESAALDAINAEAVEIIGMLGELQEGAEYCSLGSLAHSFERAYDLVQKLKDDQLERLFVFLSAISFGQGPSFSNYGSTRHYALDTDEDSVFNRVALSLGVDMRRYWTPDEWFLGRRTMSQLGNILSQSGLSRLYGNGKDFKKTELVPMMVRYFNKVRTMTKPKGDQKQARDWLPEAMQFPAIDPDEVKEEDTTLTPESSLAEAA